MFEVQQDMSSRKALQRKTQPRKRLAKTPPYVGIQAEHVILSLIFLRTEAIAQKGRGRLQVHLYQMTP